MKFLLFISILSIVLTVFLVKVLHFPTPSFKVGDCVHIPSYKESWDTEPITVLKIMEIGKENYKTCFYKHACEQISKGASWARWHGLSFTSQRFYEKIDCDKQEK